MVPSLTQWLSIACLLQTAFSYVDFGTITQPVAFEPTFTVPRPHQLPDDVWMRYAPFQSHIRAVAPSVRQLGNGSFATSWSMHFHFEPTRTIAHSGLRRRGVLAPRGVLPPIPTCRQCDLSGNPLPGSNSTDAGSPTCTVTDYEGVFRSGDFRPTQGVPDYCFNAGYTGPLIPNAQPTDAGLPCCPRCFPPGVNTTGIITSGVLSTTPGPGGVISGAPLPGGSRPIVTITDTATGIITSTRTTLSIETITPTGAAGSPVVSTAFNTIIGCGTARGCGTVVGSGTVYLAPFGFPAVTSSGTVSGCAPTVIGCGTMLATTGTFTGTAEITACGEGTGSATMIGSGTVWPAGFMDMISFMSSGTVTGSGRVRGCGYLTGTGTFTVTEPYSTTSTPGVTPTVNVYVSYCPPEGGLNPMMRLAGNFSGEGMSPALIEAERNSVYNGSAAYPGLSDKYVADALSAGARNYTSGNFTGNGTTDAICHVCPEDAGICCPPYTDCGSDGHCPWTALVNCGYARFGVNLVDVKNSSVSMGMGALPEGNSLWLSGLRAPGVPGSKKKGGSGSAGGVGGEEGADEEAGLTSAQKLRRRLAGQGGGSGKVHGHEHNHVLAHRVGVAHAHGH
ncbi:hypothetical protein PMZ80_003508 [Knufia obscura]|uniref:Uncharacterized protein n=2 Tax=Knufia TaxID=430999 RepID=A0AAN8ELJ6_9EURO|nr:hypothetical protein PMZ80_003508 [Knufia obscura]KAK5958574.1 hypothetical protein OHC33_000417 [Knufia fluminis]